MSKRLHRIVVGVRPAEATRMRRERIHDRPGACFAVELVEQPQDRLAVNDGARRVSSNRRDARLPPAVGAPTWILALAASEWLKGHLNPDAEVPCLDASRAIPVDLYRVQETKPPQQIHAVGTHSGAGSASSDQVTQVLVNRRDRFAAGVLDPPRQKPFTGFHQLADTRYNERRQISVGHIHIRHSGKLTTRSPPPTRSCPDTPFCSVNEIHLGLPQNHEAPDA